MQNVISISASINKTELLQKYKFKEDLNTPEIELFLRVNQDCHLFYFNPSYLVEYRVHTQSATNAGLKVHFLMNYLIEMPVSKNNESYKISFLKSLAPVSLNNLLLENKKKKAFQIMTSKYFGLQKILTIKGLIKVGLIFMPSKIISSILKK